MSGPIRIAVDAMGADDGVEPVVAGAAQVSCDHGDIAVTLVGDRAAIEQVLSLHRHDPRRLRVVHAADAICMGDKPREALKAKPNCSILVAARLVRDGEADALVSAGSTGAVILAASDIFERLAGVRRVGLAAVYPTVQRHGPHEDPFALMLDVGATLNCNADDLVAFAVMGSAYSRIISDIATPQVALLSNGSEPSKGTPAIIEAHRRLATSQQVNFAGNVEGLDIPSGRVDVVVCEGFVGNIVLKMLEGVHMAAKSLAKSAADRGLRYKLGLGFLSRGIRKISALTDWKQYGGAPIVGFDHAVIKAHGRSNARAVRNAIKVAGKTVERQLVAQIRQGLSVS